jgi:ABC-2 type transport system ATP-binding protein
VSQGAQVEPVDGFLEVAHLTTDQVGDAAAAAGVTIHELFLQRSSLEEAFMELTRDSVEYHADTPVAGQHTSSQGPPPAPAEEGAR